MASVRRADRVRRRRGARARAALAVRDTVREMNERDEQLDLQLSIAVNTGEAIVSLDARPELGESMIAGDVITRRRVCRRERRSTAILVGEETHSRRGVRSRARPRRR